MKHLNILLVCAALSGCHTSRQVPVNVEHAVHDTLIQKQWVYDSIYIDNWQSVEQRADTVFVEKAKMEYRYKLLHDTIRSIRIDSIPYAYEVEVIREVKYIPPRNKLLAGIGMATLALLALRCALFILKRKGLGNSR